MPKKKKPKTVPSKSAARPHHKFSNGLFDGLEDVAENKLHKILVEDVTSMYLTARHAKRGKGGKLIEGAHAELLVVMSARDSIISIPRAIIPDRMYGKYKLYSKDANGTDKPPVNSSTGRLVGYLDVTHQYDPYDTKGATRWELLRIYPPTDRYPLGSFHFFRITQKSINNGEVSREALRKSLVLCSNPEFQLSNNWYNTEISKRLSKFLGRPEPIPLTTMDKYMTYMNSLPGEYVLLSANTPSGAISADKPKQQSKQKTTTPMSRKTSKAGKSKPARKIAARKPQSSAKETIAQTVSENRPARTAAPIPTSVRSHVYDPAAGPRYLPDTAQLPVEASA